MSPFASKADDSILENRWCRKSADPQAAPREGGCGRDAEHKWRSLCDARSPARGSTKNNSFSESLILAQNERWQRGLGMQVGRDPEGSNIGR